MLHAYSIFPSTLDYKFLFSYLQLVVKLRHTKLDHHYMLKMSTSG